MRTTASRRNDQLLKALVAAAFAASSWFALWAMHFRPPGVAVALAAGIGLAAFFSAEAAVVIFVFAAGLPVFAASALAGVAFLIIGFAGVQYLGSDEVPVFVFAGAAVAAALLGPVWAVPVLAGYVLGKSRGALAAAGVCALLEVAGIMFGRDSIGVVFIGAAKPLLAFADNPKNLLTFSWFVPALKAIAGPGAKALWAGLAKIDKPAMLALQPASWAVVAYVAGRMRRPADDKRQLPMSAAAVVTGVAVAAVTSVGAATIGGAPLENPALAWAAVSSLLAAGVGTLLWDRAFKVLPKPGVPRAAEPRSMAEEDADVDELLRLIATAEDKIATRHTTEAVVMITDMKSFSRMTEEEGSFVTAKAIQRHRDLLLPVIESHQGHGKSTGGDGLIASFAAPLDAICAAMEMQRTLAKYNADHERERDILIRVGIAAGEVVLDKGGRPFIGNALNLSARVMSLGDGGQILATRDVIAAAKDRGLSTASHGEFELKNIANAVEVIEVLWRDGQSPCDPRTLGTPPHADEAAREPAPQPE